MIESRLQTQLGQLTQMLRRQRRCRALTKCFGGAALFGLVLLAMQSLSGLGVNRYTWVLPLAVGMAAACFTLMRRGQPTDETQELIREIQQNQPEIRHLLAAAAEQKPIAASGQFSYLQLRVVEEVLAHPRQAEWRWQIERRLNRARTAEVAALLALVVIAMGLRPAATPGTSVFLALVGETVTVTPGDALVERGTGLVISARFSGSPPGEATLVLNSASGKESRIPMARELADPVMAASVQGISEPGMYHVEYRGKKTRDYKITLFEYPALVRADAELRYPAYTGLTNRVIKDTLRVSAVEGSRLSYTLQLNKPVARARWIGKDQILSLTLKSNAVAVLVDYGLTNSARYTLELVDAEGRSNKFPADFVLQALTNQPANVKLVAPKGDQRVSSLEEVQLQAEASDDFGLIKYGIGFGLAGQDPKFVELGQSAPGNTKRQFSYLLSMENLGVEADQVVAYFAWADDFGPDGQPRRSFSDMYFAQVRPFEEVFRADQSGAGENSGQGGNQGQGQQGSGGGNQRVRLADLQKQIVVATWNLQREKAGAGAAPHP